MAQAQDGWEGALVAQKGTGWDPQGPGQEGREGPPWPKTGGEPWPRTGRRGPPASTRRSPQTPSAACTTPCTSTWTWNVAPGTMMNSMWRRVRLGDRGRGEGGCPCSPRPPDPSPAVEEGPVFALCMAGAGDRHTLGKWIAGLQEANPVLGRTPVIFHLEEGDPPAGTLGDPPAPCLGAVPPPPAVLELPDPPQGRGHGPGGNAAGPGSGGGAGAAPPALGE